MKPICDKTDIQYIQRTFKMQYEKKNNPVEKWGRELNRLLCEDDM